MATADTLVAWSSLRTLKAQVETVLSYWRRKRLVVAPSWLTAVYMVAGSASLASRTHAETVKGAVVSRTESVAAYAPAVPSRLSSPPARSADQVAPEPEPSVTGCSCPERSAPEPSSAQCPANPSSRYPAANSR